MSAPKPSHPPLSPELNRALRLVVLDGACSQIMGTLTTGAILVGFALLIDASNTVIGILAGLPFLSQILQIPAVHFVNRLARRRLIVVIASAVSRTFWLTLALIPWLVPPEWRVGWLLTTMVIFFSLNAIVNCAWNSWMRDLIPEQRMGFVFGRRMALATALGAVLSLIAGFSIDHFQDAEGSAAGVYSMLFLIGGGFGLLGVLFLHLTPEPEVQPEPGRSIFAVLAEPFRDLNFRKLLYFLGTWSFAVNMAAPFFSVYMLKQLHMSMTYVLALSVLSQGVNALFFRFWGRLSDRFNNKSVLGVTGFLFLLTFLIWPFTTMPGSHALTLPLLVLIHTLAGISTAGVTLCTQNIALRAAPYGRATAYLAVNALISGSAAALAPVLAGSAADFFAVRELRLDLRWIVNGDPERSFLLQPIDLSGFDFLFVIAFFVGLYAMHRLLAVEEAGEVKEAVVVQELYHEARRIARHISNVAGLRHLGYFPYVLLRYLKR